MRPGKIRRTGGKARAPSQDPAGLVRADRGPAGLAAAIKRGPDRGPAQRSRMTIRPTG
jgi:hypothetical protein